MNRFRIVILLGVPVLLLAAAMVLVLVNLGESWELHLYTRGVRASRGVLMLLIGAAAVGIALLCRWMLPAGLRALRARRQGLQQDGWKPV